MDKEKDKSKEIEGGKGVVDDNNEGIQIDEEIYNTIKEEIEENFNNTLAEKEKEIEELKKQLQVSNRKKTIIISSKREVEPKKEEPKKIEDIFM